MKIDIIAEIGVNHFGKPNLLNEYIKNFKNKGIDGISLQILNKKKVDKKLQKFCLKKKEIRKFFRDAKKQFKIVGVGIHSWDDFIFLKSLKLDFIKILGSSMGNEEYFDKVSKVGAKKIFLSTGGRSLKEIGIFLRKVSKQKLSLIFTFWKTKNFLNEIKKIKLLKNKFNLNVAYGNHFKKINLIPKVCSYKPSEIFFYIKLNKKRKYPDNIHAVPLKKLSNLIEEIKKLN